MLEFVIHDWKCSSAHQIMLTTDGDVTMRCVMLFAGRMSPSNSSFEEKKVHGDRVRFGVGTIDQPDQTQELASLRQAQVHHPVEVCQKLASSTVHFLLVIARPNC